MKKLIVLLFAILILLTACPKDNKNPIVITGNTQEAWNGSFPPSSIDDIEFNKYTSDMPDYYGKIVDTADGDTFYIQWHSEPRMGVRVKGVDTPETKDARKAVQYWGPEASAFAKNYLKVGTIVRLKFEGNITDPFGRLLAYVWVWNGTEWIYWNKLLLEEGMAFVYWIYSFEYPYEFLAYQQSAQTIKKGMWAEPEKIVNDVVNNEEEFKKKASWYRKLKTQ
jgi:micrococcal nuclease